MSTSEKPLQFFPMCFTPTTGKYMMKFTFPIKKCSGLHGSLTSYEASKLRLAKTLTQSVLPWKPGSFKHYFMTSNCQPFNVKRLLIMFFCCQLCFICTSLLVCLLIHFKLLYLEVWLFWSQCCSPTDKTRTHLSPSHQY